MKVTNQASEVIPVFYHLLRDYLLSFQLNIVIHVTFPNSLFEVKKYHIKAPFSLQKNLGTAWILMVLVPKKRSTKISFKCLSCSSFACNFPVD